MAGQVPPVESLLRQLQPQVLGALLRRAGDLATAEDAVQDAMLAALQSWPRDGVPANPGGWLFQVACRRLLDQRASDAARRTRERRAASPEEQPSAELDADGPHADDSLKLLFLCCHPALTPPSAIALTLRAVGGLTTAAIAHAFLVPEATMAQRLSRARQTVAAAGARFALPAATEWQDRLDQVRQVLYLMFNEGYAQSAGAELRRDDLAAEAIRLARLLHAALPDDPECSGLLALMLLTDARRLARTGPAGELIPLDEQDRARWDPAAIAEGTALVQAALARGAVGAYQLQAAIAALHDAAPSTATTDWPQILALYDLLLRMADNPMVALSRAIAVAMVRGPAAGLALLDALDQDPRLTGNHRVVAAQAHLLAAAGDRTGAVAAFRAAADRTASLPERHYLLGKAARLAAQ